MKLPVPAPTLNELVTTAPSDTFMKVIGGRIGPDVNGVYEHWDKLRHRTPPEGLTARDWWFGIKLKRNALARPIPLLDKEQKPFTVSLTDAMQRLLHHVDRDAAGAIRGIDGVANQDRFLMRSLIEEAMTSSQLEGAATTRAVAKEMLSTGRQPRDQSERMIYNAYAAMNLIRERGPRKITVDEILEIHRVLTDGTLEAESDCGRLRTAEDNVVIYDRGSPPTLLHVPPPASEISERLERLCQFANDESDHQFVHPVVRAIAVHFQIGYDHPFVDGNGRTARAVFYWSMMNAGYWLTEFISISSVLKKSPGRYMKAYLYTESDERDLSYFVEQQLEAVDKAIKGLHDYIAKKNKESVAARQVLRTAKFGDTPLNHRQRALLANALKDPDRSYTIASHQAAHQVTYPTALNDLNGLVAAGLMTKVRIGKSNEYLAVKDLGEMLAL